MPPSKPSPDLDEAPGGPAERRPRRATAEPAPTGASGTAAEPNGLDLVPLGRFAGYLLRRAQLRFFDDAIRVLAPFRLRPALFSALIVIDANPGRTQTEVAAALGIQRPNYVAMMDELERRGLAQRLPSATDRRSYAVVLTAEGRALLRKAVRAIKAHEDRMLKGFSAEERPQVIALLQRL